MGCVRYLTLVRRLAVLVALHLCGFAAAHEVPTDVKVIAYLKPTGDTLELTIRAPMGALIETDFPIRGPGYLEISKAESALQTAAKVEIINNIDILEDGVLLPEPKIVAARVALASDRAFDSYATARASFAEPPLSDDQDLVWRQQLFDVVLAYPIRSDRSDFEVRLRLQRMGLSVTTALTYIPPDGEPRRLDLHGETGFVTLDPTRPGVAWSFLQAGFWQVMADPAHLLLIACLAVALRRPSQMAVLAAAFAAGCVVALIAASFDFMPTANWFPTLVEALVAASIVAAGIDGILGSPLGRRWLVAAVAGVAHGYAMAFAFGEAVQLAGLHPGVGFAAFAGGVVLGIATAMLVLAPILWLLFVRTGAGTGRILAIVLFALITDIGWQWLKTSAVALAQFPLPVIDAAFLAGTLRGLLAALIFGGALYVIAAMARRPAPAPTLSPPLTDP